MFFSIFHMKINTKVPAKYVKYNITE